MERNFKEEILVLNIENGESAGEVDLKPQAGTIVGCVIFPLDESDLGTTGFVNAGIKANDGTWLSKMQDIRNYRSREASYWDGCKPLHFEAGAPITFLVNATAAFSKDVSFQLILIYKDTRQEICNL